MDIVELARDLGKKIQEDERSMAMRVASQQCDADEALQNMIGEFNLKRMAINNEAQKEDRREDLLRQYNNELRTIYAEIMQNPNMAAYTAANTGLTFASLPNIMHVRKSMASVRFRKPSAHSATT